MRRHVLATMLVVSSAALVLPATASAGGYGGSASGMSSGKNSYSNQTTSSVGPRVDRSNTWGIGSLRVMTKSSGDQKGFGVGLVSKDGSKVRGFFNVRSNTDVVKEGVTTSTASAVKVRGYTRSAESIRHISGAPIASTTHEREISDKNEMHVQSATSRSDGHVGGSSYTANADKAHLTTYNHDANTGATTRETSTSFAGGATNTSKIVEHANGKVERVFTAGSADGKVNEVRGSSTDGAQSHSQFQARVNTHTGERSGRFVRTDGDRVHTQTESTTRGEAGGFVHTKTDSTRVTSTRGASSPASAPSSSEPEAQKALGAAPAMKALPASTLGGHAEGKEGGLSVKEIFAKAAPGTYAARALSPQPSGQHAAASASADNKHVEGKEGGLSVKEIFAKAAPGTYAARALTPQQPSKHAAAE